MKYVFVSFLRMAEEELMKGQSRVDEVTFVKKTLAERYLKQLVLLK